MRSTAIAALLVAGLASADPREDLEFSRLLTRRGMADIAQGVLNRLAQSSNPEERKAGLYGLAEVTKEEASVAAREFHRSLADARPPRVGRDAILALYGKALPDVQKFVEGQPNDITAVNLYASLLQEYAQFLVGHDYPPGMEAEKQKLLEENRKQADELFQKAVEQYERATAEMKKAVKPDAGADDPAYLAYCTADLNLAKSLLAWAEMQPAGAVFLNRVQAAIEKLDDFLSEHFEDLFGGFAMLELGSAYLAKGRVLGDRDDVETAANYFVELYQKVQVDPQVPETAAIVGQAIHRCAEANNLLGRGDGKKIKPDAGAWDRTKRLAGEVENRLKAAGRSGWAAMAKLEIAEAFAATGDFERAVGLAGDALSIARSEGFGNVARDATSRLTRWVANVGSAGALDPALLAQIGDSLAAQDRVANAVTFFEKAISAAGSGEGARVAHSARLKMAQAYRRDKRPVAAAAVSMMVVDAFVASGEDEGSPLGQIAGDACDLARVAWREISTNTSRPEDQKEYQRISDLFRDRFPGHPANSDAAFSKARELWTSGEFAQAAQAFREIPVSSRNYWLAQRQVPACYAELAKKETGDKAKALWQQMLDSSKELVAAAEKAGDEQNPKASRQSGHFYMCWAFDELALWKEALAGIDDYLARYADQWQQRGKELDIKIQAHLALGETEKAEAALALLREKVPGSVYLSQNNFAVFSALRTAYKALPPGEKRTAVARRAAKLWEARLGEKKEADVTSYAVFGEALEAGEQWQEAADAFASAADAARGDPKLADSVTAYTLRAAKMSFRAALDLKKDASRRSEYLKILNDTWPLFTDVLIREKEKQPGILKALGDWQKYPQKGVFEAIKRSPELLNTTAEVYAETSPHGADGRWAAVRLLNMSMGLTRPTVDPSNPKSEELVPFWWEAAELKIRISLEIAKSGAGQDGRTAVTDALGFITKIKFEHRSLDGEDRLKRVNEMEAELKRLAPGK